MQLLPFQTFELDVPLSRDQIADRLSEQIDPSRLFRGFTRQPLLEGRLAGDTFVVWRIIPLQRWLRPVLHGRMDETESGSRIRVQAVPSRTVLFLLLVWCAALSLFLVSPHHLQVAVSVCGLLLAGWLLACGGFWMDGGACRQALCRVLNARSSG